MSPITPTNQNPGCPVDIWRDSPAEPQFKVEPQNGFLPLSPPLTKLPDKFEALETLLQDLPIMKSDGTPGLLSTGRLSEAISALPMYEIEDDMDYRLRTALYRDYCFVSSAYLLEPCYKSLIATGEYGIARDILPEKIAVPLTKLANILGAKPYLDYAYSYGLYNWTQIEAGNDLSSENLRVIRTFTGKPSEIGFILVHIDVNKQGAQLIQQCLQFLDAAEAKTCPKVAASLLAGIAQTTKTTNEALSTMWQRCKHLDYAELRTFIFGCKDQLIFPKGVIYEGVSEEPMFFRGESGSHDSIIPLLDNFCQLTEKMPDNDLTRMLKDFRCYRPRAHETFLDSVEERSKKAGCRLFALDVAPIAFLQLLDQVREFRSIHWAFVKIYIIQQTNYPMATGGSPILSWLPNQLTTVLKEMEEVIEFIRNNADGEQLPEEVERIRNVIAKQKVIMQNELAGVSNKTY